MNILISIFYGNTIAVLLLSHVTQFVKKYFVVSVGIRTDLMYGLWYRLIILSEDS